MFRSIFLSVANRLQLQTTGPLTGAGTSFVLIAEQIAPTVSIIAALVGVILGVLTYRLKCQERRYRIAEIDRLKQQIKETSIHEE